MIKKKIKEELGLLLKILSYYQIAGGVIGFGLLAWMITSISSFNLLVVIIFLVALLLFAFSIYCGIILLKRIEPGLKISKINQLLQVIHFSILGYAFQYVSGISITIGVDLTTEFYLTFNFGISSWQMNINNNDPVIAVSLNLVALFLIIYIDKSIKHVKNDHLDTSVSEIGQQV